MFSCKKCRKKFDNKEQYKIHQKIPNCQPYPCERCDRRFTFPYQLKRHYNFHEKEYKCQNCEMSFLKRSYLIKHMKIHIKDNPYACNICGKRFEKEIERNKHFQMHIDEIPFYCKECNIPFKDQGSLEDHLASHSNLLQLTTNNQLKHPIKNGVKDSYKRSPKVTKDSPPYSGTLNENDSDFCAVCDRNFTEKCTTTCYLLSKTTDKPIKCQQCLCEFLNLLSYSRHICKNPNDFDKIPPYSYSRISPEIIYCPVCGELNSTQTYNDHLKTHARVSEQKHTFCNICNKSFSNNCTLICYLKSDTGPKWFSCNHCNKKFKSVKSLHRHFISDSTQIGMECNPRGFNNSEFSPPIVKLETCIDPIAYYSCECCDINFMDFMDFSDHLKQLHGDDNDELYGCDICTATFSAADHFKEHLQKHFKNPGILIDK